ncbi:MAG: AI-2E family transporter [Gemmobacter sp.]|jgi:predicted PurR-regulated permease PerM|nr:AI-2E family transporter [Gemmobacter sp.]
MTLPVRDQAKIWGVAAAVFVVALWFLGNVILPFLVGGAIAYFMDPVADRLERAGLSRAAATGAISILAALLTLLLVLAVLPVLFTQLAALVNEAPAMLRQLQSLALERFPQLSNETSAMRQALENIGQVIQSKGGELVQTLIGSARGVISAIVFIIVVPVVTFYMLLDWDNMIARIDEILPRDHAPTIRRLASEIDATLAAFVRGQISVCLALGTFYAVTLVLAGLKFGLLIGAISGTITFIPYVGSLIGGILAIGVALFQFWGDWLSLGIVAGIFATGQLLESYVLTPKLIGSSVGLHPVWLLFALSVFGAVFGFVGMLVAVPVAAALGVLARFGIVQYKQSRLYTGLGPPPSSTP